MLDRKQLPAFMQLPYKFDMDKILSAFEQFQDTTTYQDLNYNNPDASYLQLGKEKEFHLNKFIQTASLSLIARNPLLIYATTKDFDPSEISATVGETAQYPGTRGFGFNLRVGF